MPTENSRYSELNHEETLKAKVRNRLEEVELDESWFEFEIGRLVFSAVDDITTAAPWIDREKLKQFGENYLRSMNLTHRFRYNLNLCHFDAMKSKLSKIGFELLNPKSPESFTATLMVYNYFKGGEYLREQFTVELILDENDLDDPRMTSEKRNEVRKLLTAKKVGDIFENTDRSKLIIEYLKLKHLLDPENNLHIGAENAYDLLEDVMHGIIHEQNEMSTPILTSPPEKGDEYLKKDRPRVFRVKTSPQVKLLFSTLSDRVLDVSILLKWLDKNELGLETEIRETINRRCDSIETIKMPRGYLTRCQGEKIYSDSYHYAKLVKISGVSLILKANLFKVRNVKSASKQMDVESFQLTFKIEDPLNVDRVFQSDEISEAFREIHKMINFA